jgi:hypothetical protein
MFKISYLQNSDDIKMVNDSTRSLANYKKIIRLLPARSLRGRRDTSIADNVNRGITDCRSVVKEYGELAIKIETSRRGKQFYSVQAGDNPNRFNAAIQEIRYRIKTQRHLDREKKQNRKDYYNADGEYLYTVSLVGGVHTINGEFLKVAKTKLIRKIFKRKAPKSTDLSKYLGIELEFFSEADRTNLAIALYDAGLADYVELKGDGSIRAPSGTHAHEICILVKEDERRNVINKVIDVMKAAKSGVNKTCGMHVHVDMRARDRDLVFHNLVSSQTILYAMNPKSRQEAVNGTRYCKRTTKKVFSTRIDRYHGINPQAYSEHRTIEIRIHSGSVDATKINQWLNILVAVANRPTKVKTTRRSVRSFVADFGLDFNTLNYITERINKFKGSHVEAEAA